MKKVFTEPVCELVLLTNEDIITSSADEMPGSQDAGGGEGGGGNP